MGKDKRVWRKLVKKLHRKKYRQRRQTAIESLGGPHVDDLGSKNDPDDIDLDLDIDPNFFLTMEEWNERNRAIGLKSAMQQALLEKLAKAKAEQEYQIRLEWEEKVRKETAEKAEKDRMEKEIREKQARSVQIQNGESKIWKIFGRLAVTQKEEEFNSFLDFLCGDIETPPLPYIMPEEGLESGGQVACHNFSRTGTCRFNERCKLIHHRPTLSGTILIPDFFAHLLLQESLRDEYESELGLQIEHSELYREFLEFYKDVLPEFQKHGKVIQFKVCMNYEAHLRGNVYIQYENIRSAVEAYRQFNGRFYNGKQLSLQFVKIDSWKAAICWSFLRRTCLKERACNFLHVFRNPTKEFVPADRDWKVKEVDSLNNLNPQGPILDKNTIRSTTTNVHQNSASKAKFESCRSSYNSKESGSSRMKVVESGKNRSRRVSSPNLSQPRSRKHKSKRSRSRSSRRDYKSLSPANCRMDISVGINSSNLTNENDEDTVKSSEPASGSIAVPTDPVENPDSLTQPSRNRRPKTKKHRKSKHKKSRHTHKENTKSKIRVSTTKHFSNKD